jgi:hypothetical protein
MGAPRWRNEKFKMENGKWGLRGGGMKNSKWKMENGGFAVGEKILLLKTFRF